MPQNNGYLLNLGPKKNRGRVGNIMGMIRTAAVIGAIIYAIPADPQKQQALVQSASDTFVWGATYCQREPDACRQAGEFLTAAVQKAKFGVAFVQEVASKWPRQPSGDHRQAEPANLAGEPPASAKAADTLTIDDILAASPGQPANPPQATLNPADPSVDG